MVFGGSVYTIMNRLGVTKEEAQQLYDGYFESFPGVKRWMDEVYQILTDSGQITYPEFGFVKHMDLPPAELELGDPRGYQRQFQAALRTCQNALIQGWCAFVVKKAIVDIERDLRALGLRDQDAQVVLQVHDEIGVLTKREYATQVAEIMSTNMNREFMGVQLTASPEFKRSLSKQAVTIPYDQLAKERVDAPGQHPIGAR
jgi:DNA polymerase I